MSGFNCNSNLEHNFEDESNVNLIETDFYFDENGLHQGCLIFDDRTVEWYQNQGIIEEYHDCGKQKFIDETGEPISNAVELYANNAAIWIEDLINSLDKMQQNGYDELVVAPNSFWNHRKQI